MKPERYPKVRVKAKLVSTEEFVKDWGVEEFWEGPHYCVLVKFENGDGDIIYDNKPRYKHVDLVRKLGEKEYLHQYNLKDYREMREELSELEISKKDYQNNSIEQKRISEHMNVLESAIKPFADWLIQEGYKNDLFKKGVKDKKIKVTKEESDELLSNLEKPSYKMTPEECKLERELVFKAYRSDYYKKYRDKFPEALHILIKKGTLYVNDFFDKIGYNNQSPYHITHIKNCFLDWVYKDPSYKSEKRKLRIDYKMNESSGEKEECFIL